MNKEKIKIQDESNDRKYFTQIPNMIVNHSTAYEQSLYLIMKRIAGENGSCYASLNTLSEKMGVHKTTVSKTISKLLKRKWIKETDKVKVKGGSVRQFLIVDLWRLNIEEYESGANMTTIRSGAVVDESGAVVDESGAKSDTKKNTEEEPIKKIANLQNLQGIIELFKELDPFSYSRFFGNKTERSAVERLFKKLGIIKLQNAIRFAAEANKMPYAPTTTTPIQLENNLAKLQAFYLKEKNKNQTNNKVVFL